MLVVEGYAARVHTPGDPLRYAHGDEYRDAAELQALAKQLSGLPVTLGHPPGLLRSGAKGKIVGRIDAAWLDGDRIGVRLSITDVTAAHEIEAGTKELSLGYATRVDAAGYQRDSEADHCAIVPAARCGDACSLRTDDVRLDCSATCACNAQIDRSDTTGQPGHTSGDTMPTVEELQTRVDELVGEVKILNGKLAERDALIASGAQAAESDKVKDLQTKLDEANGKIGRFDETFTKAVVARAKLEREAAGILGATTRLDDMNERAIHEAVVKRLDGGADVKTPNDAELRGQYTTLIALASKNAESQARVSEILGRTTTNPAPRADEESYESMMKNAWKKNLNGRHGAAEGR